MNKTVDLDEVMTRLKDGMTIMFGGFGGVGSPPSLIDAILEANIQDLTLIGNDAGFPQIGVGRLITEGRVKKSSPLISAQIPLPDRKCRLVH